MSILGDLGGGLLAALYDARYAVAVASAVLLVLLLLAARRYRWADVARRHPVLSAVGALGSLVVLAPVAWYLLSPVVIRTTLEEPPIAAAAASPEVASPTAASPSVAPASPAPSSPSAPSPLPATTIAPDPTPAPWTPAPTRTGRVRGTDDFHFGRGTATLTETAPGEFTIRLEDFSVRNGPDLYVYLSPEPRDYGRGAIEVAKLRATDGSFNVRVPAGTDVSGVRSVLIWCKQFSHLFAWATLES